MLQPSDDLRSSELGHRLTAKPRFTRRATADVSMADLVLGGRARGCDRGG